MLIFDINAKFASFKKFYTNSSTMTYIFPPRTTIEGIIGAIMGYDFNSYYSKLNLKNALIATSLKSKIRTYMTNLNYIKNPNYLLKWKKNSYIKNCDYGYTQIPFEFLIPISFSSNIRFRIYFFSKDKSLMEELKDKVKENKPIYPVSMGNANMLASLHYIADAKFDIVNEEKVYITPPAPIEYIKGICMDKESNDIHIQDDIMPIDFDKNRFPITKKYIFERDGKRFYINTDKPVVHIEYNNEEENILFPEVASNEFLFT